MVLRADSSVTFFFFDDLVWFIVFVVLILYANLYFQFVASRDSFRFVASRVFVVSRNSFRFVALLC